MVNVTPFLPGLSPVAGKSLTVSRDAGSLTSNGGLIVLREAAKRLGIAGRIAKHIPDQRNPLLVRHSHADMVLARAMMIAAGHEDCDDIDSLKSDPALKIACDRAPETGADLMSQPTLSRLESAPDAKALYRIGRALIDLFLDGTATAPKSIVLDIDDTNDLVHGGQQLALFNTHAGGHCFQPIHIFEANSGKPLVSLLRAGKRPSGEEIAQVLWHVIHRIRRRWPKVAILVRGDGHYCAPEVLDLLGRLACDYILGLPRNTTLDAMAAPWKVACEWRRIQGGPKRRRFHQFRYAAGSWSQQEKVIARVEATDLGTDARFIVTNLPGRAKHLYERVYCARGRMENLIKDMKLYTRSDKTACHRWQANQFRLFLHQAAYWLLHSVRCAAPKRSRWRSATFATIRSVFVTIACRVDELKRSIKLSFAKALPHADALALITARLTAADP
jgi:Transposase DDE domain group 1